MLAAWQAFDELAQPTPRAPAQTGPADWPRDHAVVERKREVADLDYSEPLVCFDLEPGPGEHSRHSRVGEADQVLRENLVPVRRVREHEPSVSRQQRLRESVDELPRLGNELKHLRAEDRVPRAVQGFRRPEVCA